MANEEHIDRLKQGVEAWNRWREATPNTIPDLREANLSGTQLSRATLSRTLLSRANLSDADLSGANLYNVILFGANISRADLSRANLHNSMLSGANLSEAKLFKAKLSGAILCRANLSEANLSGADLSGASLVEANLTGANLDSCKIFGVSAWKVRLEGATQQNLIVTGDEEPEITVDNIEVAQFIYLLLHNEKIRDAIDTIGKKGVLLLGRFTGGRITILERLRNELRKRGYLPMVFNFDRPETKDFTETVRTLVGLSRFVIADITNPRSTPLELQATVPDYMVPFVPIIEEGQEPFAMFQNLWVKHREWVFEPISYANVEDLAQGLDEAIIGPALVRSDELVKKKAEEMPVRRIADIMSGAHRSP